MNVVAQSQPVGLRQLEPPVSEGRKMYPLYSSLGPNLTFLSGAEIFEWKSNSLGVGSPSAIMGAWIDATNITVGKNLVVSFNNGLQVFEIAGGSQGYIVCTPQQPVDVLISTNNGAGAVVTVILYNYNPLFTGIGQAAQAATASASTSGNGAGSAGSGGGGGGGIRACFTGETRVQTLGGWVTFDSLPPEFDIVNETGKWHAQLLKHEVEDELVIPLPGARGRVNLIHGIKTKLGEYVEAGKIWPDLPRTPFTGTLYNLHVTRSMSGAPATEEDAHYVVEPNVIAHNVQPYKG